MREVPGSSLGLAAASAIALVAALGLPQPDADAARAEVLARGWWWFRVCGVGLAAALAASAWGLARAGAPARTAASTPWQPLDAVALGGLLALAAVLRLIGLGSGLWYDEVVTLVEFVRLSPAELLTTYTTTNNHILFSLLANASIAVFGESPWALRLPAALFGVACVGVVYALGLRLASRFEAGLAALLVAISYHHVWFSQNARGYTGIGFFALLGTLLFLRGLREGGRGLWLAYAAVLALGLYTHLSAVFVFASHGLVFLVVWALSRRGTPGWRVDAWPLLGFALGGLLTLQLFAPLLPQVVESFASQARAGTTTVAASTGWKNPLWTLLEIARGFGLGPASAVGAAAAAGIGALGVWSLARRDAVATAVMLLPTPITLLALLALSFNVWPRYFLVSLGFAVLFLSRGIVVAAEGIAAALERRGPRLSASRLAAAAAAAAVAGSLLLLPRNYAYPKQDYAGARDFIERRRAPGDAVATLGLASLPYARLYAPHWTAVESLDELGRVQRSSPAVWLVYSFPRYTRALHAPILEHVERDFELVQRFPGTLGDGEIAVWRSPAGAGTGDARP